MKTPKHVKEIKHRKIEPEELVGLRPDERGRYFEDVLEEQGHYVNRSAGVDLVAYNTEVKTKDINSNSPWSISGMTTDDVIHTSYEDSPVYEKMQRQLQQQHDKYGNTYGSKVYDFTHKQTQNKIKQSYEACRQELIERYINGTASGWNNTKTHGIGNFQREKLQGSWREQWRFRISTKGMKELNLVSSSRRQFDKLFEEE